MTKEEILNETIKYYGEDTSRRSLDGNGKSCKYIGPSNKRCAFSRCVKNEHIAELGDYEGRGASTLLKELGEDILKDEYQGHDPSFWMDLQDLHDFGEHWNRNRKYGLTEEGIHEVEKTCDRFELDKSQIIVFSNE